MDIINLNWIILFLIAIYILQGLHKGFLISVANTVGMAVSWLVGFLFSPLMSQGIAKGSFYQFLYYFTNGARSIAGLGQPCGDQPLADTDRRYRNECGASVPVRPAGGG